MEKEENDTLGKKQSKIKQQREAQSKYRDQGTGRSLVEGQGDGGRP